MIAERMQRQGAEKDTVGRTICLALVADDLAVRSGLRQLRRWMAACAAPSDLTGRTELVLAEVLNNITEHGYGSDEGGRISIRCTFERTGLRVVVTDSGQAVPATVLQRPARHGLEPCQLSLPMLPEGGFGWSLIHELTRELTCRRDDDANRLCFLVPYHDGGRVL